MQQIPIFVINMKKDTDRKKYMEQLSEEYGLFFKFIEAIDGKNLNEKGISKAYNKEKSIRALGREMTKSEIGCALSHLSVYKQMIDQNIEIAIVFEDDIQIEKGFTSIMNTIKKLPSDWELVLLGYHRGGVEHKKTISSSRYKRKITDKYTLVRLIRLGLGSYGYLINLQGAKKLVKQLETIKKPIDNYTGSDTYVNLYAISPRVIGINNVLTEQSNLEIERNLIVDKYNKFNDKKKIKSKLVRELIRPLLQLKNLSKLYYDKIKILKKYS